MGEFERGYKSYLLRVWQTRQGGGIVWRASVESTLTGQRHTFTSLETLLAFLATNSVDLGEDGLEELGL